MFGTLGFSYVGILFLFCLFIPNIMYLFNLPIDYVKTEENKILGALEKIGQALCTILLVISKNLDIKGINLWTIWLGIAIILMVMYLRCWVRYFQGGHVSKDFYTSFLGIPLPMAVLPVSAILLLSVYGKVLGLGIASVILGIGHIGITAQNKTSINI